MFVMPDNIKVAIKVRPLVKREKDKNLPIQWIVQENTIVATDSKFKKRGNSEFQFDHIFDTNASNNDVFDNTVKPIVDAAVNGFNGTVFTYGQTNTGKTYTMMGTPEEPGMISLAIKYMFDVIANTPRREFLLRVSYLEIYNDRINDLLNKGSLDLKIHEDINGQVFVNCKEEVTNCPENVLFIMNKGNKHRRIGETNMNERSSRSHTIFRITIKSHKKNASSDVAAQVSQLNMIDLAGSQKVRQTKVTEERFKESRHINSSLSALALVIKQLSKSHNNHINFRNKKLTRLLQASLGSNAMTAIICTISPVAPETRFTLSIASTARKIKNQPVVNKIVSHQSDEVPSICLKNQRDMSKTELKKVNRSLLVKKIELIELKLMRNLNAERIKLHKIMIYGQMSLQCIQTESDVNIDMLGGISRYEINRSMINLAFQKCNLVPYTCKREIYGEDSIFFEIREKLDNLIKLEKDMKKLDILKIKLKEIEKRKIESVDEMLKKLMKTEDLIYLNIEYF